MNLAPLPIQKFFNNNGRPLDGGLLFTYAAGTDNKIATYKDADGVAQNTNPIELDFRGECRLWIDPTLAYKFVLSPRGDTDPPTDPIWTVDDITAGPAPRDNAAVDTGSVNNIQLTIPLISSPVAFTRIVFKAANTNTGPVTISINGGTAKNLTWQNIAAFAGGEIQANGVYEAIYDGAQWQLQGPTLQPPQMRTAAEITADVMPVNYAYEPGNVLRYGADATGVASSTTAFNEAIAANGEVYVPSGTYLLNALDTITTGKIIFGDGKASKLLFNTTGFGIAFNVSTVHPGQSTSFTVHDLLFDNVTNVPAAFIRSGTSAQGSVNGLIERCYFSECSATYCIDNYIGYGLKIRSCVLNDITGSAIRFQDSVNQLDGYSFAASIDGCDITRPSVDGIVIEGAQVLGISNTIIEGCGGRGIRALPLTNTVQAWNIHLDAVYFEANTGVDLDLSDVDGTFYARAVITACQFTGTPTIALGSRSDIVLVGCQNSGGDVCTVSGSSNASAMLIGSVNFSQSGTFDWVEIGGANSTQNTTKQRSFALTWGADTVAPAIGNGTITSYYTRIGNQVFVDVAITMGSTTTFGTGDWFFGGLPFTCNANIGAIGASELRDDSANANFVAVARMTAGGTTVRILADTTTGSGVDSTQPFTWALNDVLRFSLVYNAA